MRKTLTAAAALATVFCAAFATPVIDDILSANKAAMGGDGWSMRAAMSEDATMAGQGLTGTAHEVIDLKTGRSVLEYTLGPANGAEGYDGIHAWQKDMSGTIALQDGGDAHALAVNEAYRNSQKWWLPDHGGAAIVDDGTKSDATGTYHVLTVTPEGGKPFDAWFSSRTHLLGKTVEQQGSRFVTVTFSDYQPIDGLLVARKMVIDPGVGPKYQQTIALTKVAFIDQPPGDTFAPPKVALTDFSIDGAAAQTELPVQLINNHIYGAARVNGKGPFVFIFDTGGHNIVTPPITKELGLAVQGKLPGSGAGEGVMESGFAKIAELRIGNAVVKDQLFLVLPLDVLGNVEGVPMPGMVGYETFRRFVTRIDYGAGTLTLIDPKHFDSKDAGTPVKFVFHDSIPEVIGTFEGIPAKFDLDTGARTELTLTKPFSERNNLRASHPKGVDAVDGWGVGGPSRGYVTRGREMTIGPFTLDNVVTTFATQEKGAFAGGDYSGNVGGGILKRFVVTFDYEHQVIYLKRLPSPVADTGTFDRAGMWINQSGPGFAIVDVTAGSPADLVGLKPGDLIVAVDDVPATMIHLYDLRAKLRDNPAGTPVKFTVLHKHVKRHVTILLRDLI